MVVYRYINIWFDKPRSLLQVSKKKSKTKKKILVDCYRTEFERTENISPTASKKRRKLRQSGVVSWLEVSEISISGESRDSSIIGVMAEEKNNLHNDSSQWKNMPVTSSHRNFGKIVYIDFSHFFGVWKGKITTEKAEECDLTITLC